MEPFFLYLLMAAGFLLIVDGISRFPRRGPKEEGFTIVDIRRAERERRNK